MPGAEESYRYGRSHFRVARKVFATLEGVADSNAVVLLTPEQQAMFGGAVFEPEPGGEGRLGVTIVRLAKASEATVTEALTAAWENVVPKHQRARRKGVTGGQ